MEALEEKALRLIKNRCSWLQAELDRKKGQIRKVSRYLQRHKDNPSMIIARTYREIVKRIMRSRRSHLSKAISVLVERIRKYTWAQSELQKGERKPALEVLCDILKDYPATIDSYGNGDPEIGNTSTPNPVFYELQDLIRDLAV